MSVLPPLGLFGSGTTDLLDLLAEVASQELSKVKEETKGAKTKRRGSNNNNRCVTNARLFVLDFQWKLCYHQYDSWLNLLYHPQLSLP